MIVDEGDERLGAGLRLRKRLVDRFPHHDGEMLGAHALDQPVPDVLEPPQATGVFMDLPAEAGIEREAENGLHASNPAGDIRETLALGERGNIGEIVEIRRERLFRPHVDDKRTIRSLDRTEHFLPGAIDDVEMFGGTPIDTGCTNPVEEEKLTRFCKDDVLGDEAPIGNAINEGRLGRGEHAHQRASLAREPGAWPGASRPSTIRRRRIIGERDASRRWAAAALRSRSRTVRRSGAI